MYFSQGMRPDLQLAVAFLTKRVQAPDVDDQRKLGQCIYYIQVMCDLPYILEAKDLSTIKQWVDAPFAVHKD